jgi:hypothetical protein
MLCTHFITCTTSFQILYNSTLYGLSVVKYLPPPLRKTKTSIYTGHHIKHLHTYIPWMAFDQVSRCLSRPKLTSMSKQNHSDCHVLRVYFKINSISSVYSDWDYYFTSCKDPGWVSCRHFDRTQRTKTVILYEHFFFGVPCNNRKHVRFLKKCNLKSFFPIHNHPIVQNCTTYVVEKSS